MARESFSPKGLSRSLGSLILFVVVGVLAIAVVMLGIERHKVAEAYQPLFNAFAAVCGPHTMGQSFVATEPNLNRIDLWLAWSPSRQLVELTPTPTSVPTLAVAGNQHVDRDFKYYVFLPIVVRPSDELRYSTSDYLLNTEGCDLVSRDDGGAITISLRPKLDSSTVIATATVQLESVEDLSVTLRRPYVYRSFTFPPIPDSAGRTFYLSVEAPSSSALAPLLARYHSNDVYAGGARYVDDVSTKGDLAFRLHYQQGPLSDVRLLLRRLTQSRPVPFSWSWLYPLILAAYVGSVALFVRAVTRDRTDRND
jgi:hypothetical protein